MSVFGTENAPRDLDSLVVVRVGAVVETGDVWEPYRLVGPSGEPVSAVTTYLGELQAAGRSAATQRSYAMALLRWFRFLWSVDVGWQHATRVEARDFSRWIQLSAKPARPHWRSPPQEIPHCLPGNAVVIRDFLYRQALAVHLDSLLNLLCRYFS